jgi:hypothetical protein
MTIDTPIRPFIARFGSVLDAGCLEVVRYDEKSQVSHVLSSGIKSHVSTALTSIKLGTRATKVAQETTDDD